ERDQRDDGTGARGQGRSDPVPEAPAFGREQDAERPARRQDHRARGADAVTSVIPGLAKRKLCEGKGTQGVRHGGDFTWVFVRWRYELPHIALSRDARRA